jgi:hypothetical protein
MTAFLFQPSGEPAQPRHPDFVRLARIVSDLDTETAGPNARTIEATITEAIDEPSLQHHALERAKAVIRLLDLPEDMLPVISAAWLNAFIVGVRFQKEGGHQEP